MFEHVGRAGSTKHSGVNLTLHVLAAFFAFLLCTFASAKTAVPSLRSPVTDLTNTLTPSQVQSLEQQLRALETRKGSQVAVLIVPTTEPESIEEYSIRVAEAWKLGRKEPDDGVLFLIAKNDRTMRIEVGYGLEGVLPDAVAARIIRNDVTPHFRAGEFYLGIVAGVDRISSAITGEALPTPTIVERARRPNSGFGSFIPILLMAGFVVGGILRAIFGRFLGATFTAAGAGLIVWFVFGTLAVAIIGAIIAFVISLIGGGGNGWSGGSRRGWGGSNWGSGWGGGGSSWGGGGGWSGGGGGFGGGGASGKW